MDDQLNEDTKASVVVSVTSDDIPSVAETLSDQPSKLFESEDSRIEPINSRNSSIDLHTEEPLKDMPAKLPHKLKTILWHNKRVSIVTQNENGPCPLIAIANVLLLRGKINLPSSTHSVSADELVEHVANSILESVPKDLPESKLLNFEQNMQDAMAVLPRLMTGLDVNVKFTGVQDFEYTPECIIFDLLDIPLYHGWLVDPQDKEAAAAIGGVGYNQLVDKIISNKTSENVAEVTQALIAEQFLESTASQMTCHGLCELKTAMRDNEIGVLFRNNHFATVLKKGGTANPKPKSQLTKSTLLQNQLFQLVTDQGFLHESEVVWETVDNIDGAGDFVDGSFKKAPPKSSSSFAPTRSEVTQEQQIDQDFLVALSLQEDQKNQSETDQAWEEYKLSLGNSEETITDAQLARQLQERENEQHGQTAMDISPRASETEPDPPDEPAPAPGPQTPPERKFLQHCRLQ